MCRFFRLMFLYLVIAPALFTSCAHDQTRPIESISYVRQLPVKVVGEDQDGRIHTFQPEQGFVFEPGQVMTVYDQGSPLMAFRVLPSDEYPVRFTAIRIRRYGQSTKLDLNKRYFVISETDVNTVQQIDP
jgi:hypothetical protein